MEFSKITLKTAEGDFVILAGPKTVLRIDSPGAHGLRTGARFAGFAGDSTEPIPLRSERITRLRLLKDVGDEPAWCDVLEVTLACGDTQRTVWVPISTILAPPRPVFYDPDPCLNPPSKLILSGVPDAPHLWSTHERVLSLSGLVAIKVDDPAASKAAA